MTHEDGLKVIHKKDEDLKHDERKNCFWSKASSNFLDHLRSYILQPHTIQPILKYYACLFYDLKRLCSYDPIRIVNLDIDVSYLDSPRMLHHYTIIMLE